KVSKVISRLPRVLTVVASLAFPSSCVLCGPLARGLARRGSRALGPPRVRTPISTGFIPLARNLHITQLKPGVPGQRRETAKSVTLSARRMPATRSGIKRTAGQRRAVIVASVATGLEIDQAGGR